MADYDEVNMENHAVNLQDKIQKLIDQYTLDKKRLEELESKNKQLTEENSQLFAQIEASGTASGELDAKFKALQNEYDMLQNRYNELQNMLAGFESIAEGAIQKIDSIFPLVDNGN
jgi:chromosome segregation ATPase